MRKEFNVSSDSGDSGNKNTNMAVVALMVGSDEGWSVKLGGRFCFSAFGRNLASVTVKLFSHLIYVIMKFYIYYTYRAICKDNPAKNRVAF
jgi:hypothetical protein